MPMIAILLLKSKLTLSAEQFCERLRVWDAKRPSKVDVTARDGAMLITCGRDALTAMVMDCPVPAGTLDRAYDGNMTWPQAQGTLAGHTHHIVVGCLRDSVDKSERISNATSLTLVCAALAELTNCLGVYWTASETVCETRNFIAEASQTLDGRRAPHFWTRLYLFRGEARGDRFPVGCVTRGLHELVGREIEFEPAMLAPADVAQRVLGAAHLLLFGPKEIKDGDTIGISSSERILVRHADKGQRVASEIVRLEYGVNGGGFA